MLFATSDMIKSSTSSDGGKKKDKSTLHSLDLQRSSSKDEERKKKIAAKKKKKEKEKQGTELPEQLSEWERQTRIANKAKWDPCESFLARLDDLAAMPNTNANLTTSDANGKTGETAGAKGQCVQGRGAHQFLFALWALQLNVDRTSCFGQLPYELLLFVFDLRMRLTLLASSTSFSGYTAYQQRVYAEDFNLLRTIFRVEGQSYCDLKNRYHGGNHSCTYSASTLIMQLLRDNLTKWTTDLTDEGNEDEDNY